MANADAADGGAPQNKDAGRGGVAHEAAEEELPASPLHTDHGSTLIAEQVVQKIAGIACREVPGVFAMGNTGRRMLNSLTERIPGSTTNVANGVQVEKGERQCAIDVSVIVEYGYSVVEVANKLRESIIDAVEYGTGLEVVEVNIQVTDIEITDGDDAEGDMQVPVERVRRPGSTELS